jgi:hypothetical protein
MRRPRTIALATTAVAAVLVLSSCSSDGYTDNSMRSLRYEKGSLSGGKFVECVAPGKKIVTNDKLYAYPITQREDVWDSNEYHKGSNSADHDDLVIGDRDGNDVHYKIKVPFTLNTSCDPVTVDGKKYPGGALEVWHELISKTRKGYFKEDGTYGGEQSGWIWLMNNHISSSVEDILNRATRTTTVDAVWRGATADTTDKKTMGLDEVRQTLQDNLQAAVNASTETNLEFYHIGQIKIYSATPDSDYAQQFKDRNAAQISAQTAKDNQTARVAQAKADAAVKEAQAKAQQAEIDGYGGPQWYACAKSLEHNLPCFQPGGTLLVTGNNATGK